MTPQLEFGSAVKGDIPESAAIVSAVVMGKDIDPMELASGLGQFVADGTARPVNLVAASTIAAPSGGLAPKGNENTPYTYKGGEMFGVSDGPTGP